MLQTLLRKSVDGELPSERDRNCAAAVQDTNEIKQFLKHVHLYPDPGDIVAFLDVDVEPEPDWDDSASAEATWTMSNRLAVAGGLGEWRILLAG